MEYISRLIPDRESLITKVFTSNSSSDKIIRGALVRCLELLSTDPSIEYLNISRGSTREAYERRKADKICKTKQRLKAHQKKVEESKQDLLDLEAQVYKDEIPYTPLPELKKSDDLISELRNELYKAKCELHELNVNYTRLSDRQNEDEFSSKLNFGLAINHRDEMSDLKVRYVNRMDQLKKMAIEESERWYQEYHNIYSSLKIMHIKEELPFNLKEVKFNIEMIRKYEI